MYAYTYTLLVWFVDLNTFREHWFLVVSSGLDNSVRNSFVDAVHKWRICSYMVYICIVYVYMHGHGYTAQVVGLISCQVFGDFFLLYICIRLYIYI